MKVIVNGAKGRMGQAVVARLHEAGHEIAARIDPAMAAGEGFKDIRDFKDPADVIIDFSSPAALESLLDYACGKNCPLVLATTGYSDKNHTAILAAAKKTAIFKSANMSLGVNLLKRLITQAAHVLGDDFDVEIIETHHSQKKDAPSGTALLLYDALKDAYTKQREMKPGRFGGDALREPKEIGIHAVRGGTVPGIHEVGFYGYNEVITLTHSAQSREVFAIGAVKAAEYLMRVGAGEKPGLYTMDDLLG